MLNIAIVVESFPTISETFITNKVLHLCKRGHQVTVFTHRKSQNNQLAKLYQLDRISNLSVMPPAIPVTAVQWIKTVLQKPGVFVQAGTSLKKIKARSRSKLLSSVFKQQNFDVIHFEFSALALLYKDVIPALKPVTVVSCRGTAEKVKPLTIPGRKELLTDLFSKIDSIHCVSADMAQTITPYCTDTKKIFINRPSIDIQHFNRTIPYEPKSKITILTIGRFTFQKGYLVGLLAVKELQKQNIFFEWQIVGDGPQMEEMMFHIHTLGLQNHVTLLGKKNKEEIVALYNNADIFLLSSVYEGIANVVLEAMAMQLPVVSTTSGGLQEVIEHNIDGLLAEVYDHVALATELISLCRNYEKRKALGSMARQKIIQQFTIERQIDEFEMVYNGLIKNKADLKQ